jgi:hypothetical protein
MKKNSVAIVSTIVLFIVLFYIAKQPNCNKEVSLGTHNSQQLVKNSYDSLILSNGTSFVEALMGLTISLKDRGRLASISNLTTLYYQNGKYTEPVQLQNGSSRGIFERLSPLSKSIAIEEGKIICKYTYQLVVPTLKWDTLSNNIKIYGREKKILSKDITTENGSLLVNLLFIFDEKTMCLLYQKSKMTLMPNSYFNNDNILPFEVFAEENLVIKSYCNISWYNKNCLNNKCTTGLVSEDPARH